MAELIPEHIAELQATGWPLGEDGYPMDWHLGNTGYHFKPSTVASQIDPTIAEIQYDLHDPKCYCLGHAHDQNLARIFLAAVQIAMASIASPPRQAFHGDSIRRN